ncbi:MAG: molybdopterin-dependent oxidoreductase, partial [Acidobacteriota bacterium]
MREDKIASMSMPDRAREIDTVSVPGPSIATTTVQTACPLDCPDTCSVVATVEQNGGTARVVKLDGDRRNPVTAGTLCGKVRRFHHLAEGPDRLLHPAVRDGRKGEGQFRRVGWDEALDLIARQLTRIAEEHGGDSILPLCYGGSNGLLTQDTTDALLFGRLGAAHLRRTLCAAATGAAQTGLYGKMPGVAYQDYP